MIDKILNGRTDLIFEFIKDGNSATSCDTYGVPLIKWCAYYGDVSAIRFLLSNGESLNSLGRNLDLNGAAFHGHWQLCQYLIENGADVNAQDQYTGETPLHSSLCKANRPIYEAIVEILLASGANPNIKTNEAVETEAFMRDVKTKGETPLHRAAAYGSEKSIRLLLDSGAEKSVKDMYGETPLSWASFHLRPAAILKLLCYGEHKIHPTNHSNYDHGSGWHQLDPPLGKPHIK